MIETIKNLKKKLLSSKLDDNTRIEIFIELSHAYLDKNSDKSLEYAKKSLELSEKINNEEKKANSLSIIGNIYYCKNIYEEALKFYKKASKLFKIIGDKNKLGNSLDNIGIIYRKLSSYDNALLYHLESCKICENIGDTKGIAYSYNSIGNTYLCLTNYEKALIYFQKSLEIMQTFNDKGGISNSLNNIGIIFKKQRNYEKALEYYTKSLKIFEEINNKKRIGISLSNIGNIHEHLKNYDKTLEFHFKALTIFEEIEDKWEIARTFNNIGRLFLEIKNFSKSFSYLERSLKLTREIQAKELIKDNYNEFIALYSAQNNYQKAFEYSELYSKIKDSIFTEESSKKIAEMQTRYETEKKEKEAEIYRIANIELVSANEQLEKEIIQRKKAEKELKIGRKRLIMLNKIIRHDLANDFIVIKSAVKIFKKTSNYNMLAEIEKRVNVSLKTIADYKKYESFIDLNSELIEIEINKLINDIITEFSEIKFNIEGNGRVLVDDALKSVFTNLITNSIKHGNSTKIDIKISSNNNLCKIKFMDNGTGIPDKIKDKIFKEGFYFGKSGHTGIGLHIVRKTIERYGGSISVEDNKPTGAVFVISLRKAL
ncbi:MAG: tetratricopeptide repeat-containing sensor histidine kinase [Candidatus Cloacimonetes bacterium]|nr:tetratricopeptide repeat-containing sensor histidine kinase [Candidatus Cloacimonadota bacterium]